MRAVGGRGRSAHVWVEPSELGLELQVKVGQTQALRLPPGGLWRGPQSALKCKMEVASEGLSFVSGDVSVPTA